MMENGIPDLFGVKGRDTALVVAAEIRDWTES
jgi:hypothetical protein